GHSSSGSSSSAPCLRSRLLSRCSCGGSQAATSVETSVESAKEKVLSRGGIVDFLNRALLQVFWREPVSYQAVAEQSAERLRGCGARFLLLPGSPQQAHRPRREPGCAGVYWRRLKASRRQA